MIPKEAIEAAAKSAREASRIEPNCDYIRFILESAAPHIRAQVLEDVAEAIKRDGDPRDLLTVNWLKARANAERSHAV